MKDTGYDFIHTPVPVPVYLIPNPQKAIIIWGKS